jgi:hypothetical protein
MEVVYIKKNTLWYPIVKDLKEIIVYVKRQKESKGNYTYSNYMQ